MVMYREVSKIIFESFKLFKNSSKKLNDLASGPNTYLFIILLFVYKTFWKKCLPINWSLRWFLLWDEQCLLGNRFIIIIIIFLSFLSFESLLLTMSFCIINITDFIIYYDTCHCNYNHKFCMYIL